MAIVAYSNMGVFLLGNRIYIYVCVYSSEEDPSQF